MPPRIVHRGKLNVTVVQHSLRGFLSCRASQIFAVLNLFIGVIVDAMQTEHEAEARGERDAMREDTQAILTEVKALRKEVAALRAGKD